MPGGSHIIYIPLILIVGMVIGFIMGGRAVRDAENFREEQRRQRAAAREARKAKSSDTASAAADSKSHQA